MRKGIMALEGLELNEEIVEQVDGTPQVDFLEAPENDTLEMNAAEGELVALDDQSAEADATCATLAEMHDALGASAEEGGMSEPEARAIEIAVEHLRSRVGFTNRSKSMPAMEAFANKTSRVRATRVAMESIAETGKNIMAGIVHAFETAIAWVKKHWQHLKEAVGKYAERAAQLAKAGAARSKEAVSDAQVSTAAFAKNLNVGGKLLAGKEFVSKYTSYVTSLGAKDADSEAAAAEHLGEAIIEMVTKAEDESAFAAAKKKAAEAVASFYGKVSEIKQTFGQMSIFTSAPKEGEEGSFKNAYLKMGPSSDATDVEIKREIPALTPAEVVEVAEAAKKHFDLSKSWESAIARIEKIQEKVKAACKSAMASTGEASSKAKNEAVSAARAFISMTSAGLSSVRANAVNVSKSALDYCGASLKGIGAAPAEAPKEAAAA